MVALARLRGYPSGALRAARDSCSLDFARLPWREWKV